MASTNITSYSWTTLDNDESFKMWKHSCGAYKNRYIINTGGCAVKRGLNIAAIYDTLTQKYTRLPDLPFLGTFKGAIVKDYLYVVRSLDLEVYRLCLNTPRSLSTKWTWKPQTKLKLKYYPRRILSNGKYLFFLHTKKMECYDPMTETLYDIPPIHLPCNGYITAITDKNIFIMGGFDHCNHVSMLSVQVFDIAKQSWSQGPPLPEPLYHSATTVFKKWIIVTGGFKETQYNTKTFILDTCSQEWSKRDIALSMTDTVYKYVPIGSNIIKVSKKEIYPMQVMNMNHIIPHWQWEVVKELVLLQRLVEEDRVCPAMQNSEVKNDTKKNTNTVIEKLVTDAPLDIFRNILLFLL